MAKPHRVRGAGLGQGMSVSEVLSSWRIRPMAQESWELVVVNCIWPQVKSPFKKWAPDATA